MLQEVILTPEEWTPQNGLLTAAQKLQVRAIHGTYDSSKPGAQRKQIFEHYKDQIKACCMFVVVH
jgi:long-chain acyl-CoA synthetase